LFRFRRGPLAPDHQDLADLLHWYGAQRLADPREAGLALPAVGPGHTHLDQLVALEALVDLAQHRIGQPSVADGHDRVQVVGAGLEGFALSWCELDGH
jgi:hypothetical protein